MSVSPASKIWPIMSICHGKDIKSALDVGTGFGKYGVLLREQLDIRLKRYKKEDWKATIDGIEVWPDIISPLHHYIYSNIFIGNALELSKIIHDYDIILLVEVIEHLPKKDGAELLQNLWKKCNLGMAISTPQIFHPGRHSGWPNSHEDHVCLWTTEEISKLFKKTEIVNPTTIHILR